MVACQATTFLRKNYNNSRQEIKEKRLILGVTCFIANTGYALFYN